MIEPSSVVRRPGRVVSWWPLLNLLIVVINLQMQTSAAATSSGKRPSKGATAIDFKALRERERQRMMKEQLEQKKPAGAQSLLAAKGPLDLGSFSIPDSSLGIHLIPNWLTEDEAQRLRGAIDAAPGDRWVGLTRRRLQNLGGTPSMDGMRPMPLPHYAKEVMKALSEAGIFPPDHPPNHILLNEYRDGQGISPHKDGPLYYPLVAVLSIGSSARIHFSGLSNGMDPVAAVDLPHASLLVFRGDAYEKYFHTIPASQDSSRLGDRRLSLTVRHVLRVLDEKEEVLETAESRREEERKEKRFLYSISDHRPDLPNPPGLE